MATTDNPDGAAITADALSVVRQMSRDYRGGRLRVDDPYAGLFVNDGGRALLQLATSSDRAYLDFNLARYRYFSERIASIASEVEQLVMLGSGFDTRTIWMPELQEEELAIFEIDVAASIEEKRATLAAAGIGIPSHLKFIPADLNAPDLAETLAAHGYRFGRRTLVVAEGVFFFLPAETAARLIAPATLGLGPGSRVLFDYWSNERIDALNARVAPRIGRELFGSWSLGETPGDVVDALAAIGYTAASVMPLERIVAGYLEEEVEAEFPAGWCVAEGGDETPFDSAR